MRKTRSWPFKAKLVALLIVMVAVTTFGARQSPADAKDDGEKVNVVCTEPFPLSDDESLALSMFLLAQDSAQAGRATAEIVGPQGLVYSVDFDVAPNAVMTIDFGSRLNGALNGFFVGCVKSKGRLGQLLGNLGKGIGGGLGKLSGNFSKKKPGGLIEKIGLGCPCCCAC